MRDVDNEHEMEVLASTQHTETETKKGENESVLEVTVESKKEQLDNADDRYLMSIEEDGLDENGFVVQSQVNLLSPTDRLNSASVSSLRSVESSPVLPESRTGNEKEEEIVVPIPKGPEEEEDIAI